MIIWCRRSLGVSLDRSCSDALLVSEPSRFCLAGERRVGLLRRRVRLTAAYSWGPFLGRFQVGMEELVGGGDLLVAESPEDADVGVATWYACHV